MNFKFLISGIVALIISFIVLYLLNFQWYNILVIYLIIFILILMFYLIKKNLKNNEPSTILPSKIENQVKLKKEALKILEDEMTFGKIEETQRGGIATIEKGNKEVPIYFLELKEMQTLNTFFVCLNLIDKNIYQFVKNPTEEQKKEVINTVAGTQELIKKTRQESIDPLTGRKLTTETSEPLLLPIKESEEEKKQLT